MLATKCQRWPNTLRSRASTAAFTSHRTTQRGSSSARRSAARRCAAMPASCGAFQLRRSDAVAFARALAGALRVTLAIPRRRRRHELGEESRRRLGDGVHRPREGLFVRLGWLREAADLPYVLQRGVVHLRLGRSGIDVVELLDVAAHGLSPCRPVSKRELQHTGGLARIAIVPIGNRDLTTTMAMLGRRLCERQQLPAQLLDLVA